MYTFQDELDNLVKQNEQKKEKLAIKRQQNQRLTNLVSSLKIDLNKLKEEENLLHALGASSKTSTHWMKRFGILVFKMMWMFLNFCSLVFFLIFIFIELDCNRLNCEK